MNTWFLLFFLLLGACQSLVAPSPESEEDASEPANMGTLIINAEAQEKIGIKVQDVSGRIPESARVWLDGKVWFYQRQDQQSFVRFQVKEIGGDNIKHTGVVVQGAQILLSEELKNLLPEDE